MFDNINEIIILIVVGLWSGIILSWLYWRVRITDLEKIIGNLQSSRDEKDVTLAELEILLHEQETIVQVINDQIHHKDEAILDLTSQNTIMVQSIKDLKKEITNLQSLNQDFSARIENSETRVEALNTSLAEKESEVVTYKARMKLMQDNLSIIPGIGPKVSYLLRSTKIDTFEKLAATSVETIREIIERNNPNLLRIIDPLTWPDHARLAIDGNLVSISNIKKNPKRS
jgi:predicted flap endonuclease-1-like 5' DNA nuclease